jgi:predicted nucleotidyltransferase
MMLAQPYLSENERTAIEEIKRSVLDLVGGRLKLFSVFGSKARGDFDPESDVDLAIVVEGLEGEMKRRIIDRVVDSEMEHLVVVSSLVLSLENFVDLRRRERRIALDIEHEGIAV